MCGAGKGVKYIRVAVNFTTAANSAAHQLPDGPVQAGASQREVRDWDMMLNDLAQTLLTSTPIAQQTSGFRELSFLLLGAILGYLIAVLFQLRWRYANAYAEEGAEVVALFCNPSVSEPFQRKHGLKPLAFGQDMKFMMRSLSKQGLLYVEPAASLYTTRRALVNFRPRFMIFSGHCLGGLHLCFETPDGHYDRECSLQMFINLLRCLSPLGAISHAAAAKVNAHLEQQQAAALMMQHCSRAWMERAASERARAASEASSTIAMEESDLPSLRHIMSSRVLPALGRSLSFSESEQLALSRLACMVINACCSLEVGRAVARALPGIVVICWTTLVEDAAARELSLS